MQDKSSHQDNKIETDESCKQSELTSLLHDRGHISSSKGTPSSNTVPSNCNNENNTKILRNGIDSLYLSYQGELSEESLITLTNLKKLAQSDDPLKVALAQYQANSHIFDVSSKGRKPYAFILRDNWYNIAISGSGNSITPLAHVQLSSELLTLEGVDIAVSNLSHIIKSFCPSTNDPSVSRVDLCVDFITDYPLSEIIETNWITKAREMSRYIDQRQFSGWQIGNRKKLSARLYNKTLEMQKNPRPYLEHLWTKSGWDGIQPVWRIEFEFRRESLREIGVISIDSLYQHLTGLWQYVTQEWLRLAVINPNDGTQSRWQTTDLWQVLQSVQWSGESEVSRIPVTKGRPPSDRTLFINGISGYTSFMAREGIVNPSDGAHAFFQAARQYHDNREHYTGLTFDDYIEQKIALKVKSYNSGINQPVDSDIHPADEAVSQTYRDQSDGK